MDTDQWFAFGALGLTMVGSSVTVAWMVRDKFDKLRDKHSKTETALARVEGKLQNGLTQTLNEVKSDVRKLYDMWSNRPCPEHTAKMAELERRIEQVEE